MIANKGKFLMGMMLIVCFGGVLFGMFMPIFANHNGLEYLDNLYNSISKGSAYYIENVREDIKSIQSPELTIDMTMASEVQAQQTVPLFIKAGAQVGQKGAQLSVTGNILQILNRCLDDSQHMYDNDGAALSAKYGYAEKAVMYNWYSALKAMDTSLKDQQRFNVAKMVNLVNEKAVETSYNYYGIKGQKISDRMGVVAFSLIFYVLYTLWYGFGIMFLFEGLGMQLEH